MCVCLIGYWKVSAANNIKQLPAVRVTHVMENMPSMYRWWCCSQMTYTNQANIGKSRLATWQGISITTHTGTCEHSARISTPSFIDVKTGVLLGVDNQNDEACFLIMDSRMDHLTVGKWPSFPGIRATWDPNQRAVNTERRLIGNMTP